MWGFLNGMGHVDLDLSLLVVHRKLAEQVIELIKAGGVMADGAAAPAQGNVGVRSQLGLQHAWPNLIQSNLVSQPWNVQELDLFGSRDFLTAATADQALAPMLAQGSPVSKVWAPCSKPLCSASTSSTLTL
jgi:hypothetical protein